MNRLVAMETFVRVIEAGSFSAAAKQLRVGQPAVSKTIAQLEDRLGVRLLLRSTRGLTPTEAGRSFYERAHVPWPLQCRGSDRSGPFRSACPSTAANGKGSARSHAGHGEARLNAEFERLLV